MALSDKMTTEADNAELKKIIKELQKDLTSLRGDMNDLRKDSGRFAKAGANAAQHNMEDAADKVFKMTRDKAEHLKHDAEETTESLRGMVKDNPIAALGVATVVGMIIGRRILR